MQPNQTPTPAPSQYDFFLNPNTPAPPKSKLPLPVNPGSAKGKIMLVVGGGLVLLVIIFLASTLLGGSNDGAGAALLEVAQEQSEVVRVASLAQVSAKQTNTQAFAANVQLSVTSAQQQIVPLAKKRGAKTDAKFLIAKKNSATDKALKAATENSQFDEVFTKLLTAQLGTYKQSLDKAYKTDSSKKDKAVIQSAYDGVVKLLSSVQSN